MFRFEVLRVFVCLGQDLVCLLDIYLAPLRTQTFLSEDEVRREKPLEPGLGSGWVPDGGVSPTDGVAVWESP